MIFVIDNIVEQDVFIVEKTLTSSLYLKFYCWILVAWLYTAQKSIYSLASCCDNKVGCEE